MNYDLVWDVEAYRKLERIWAEAKPIGPAVDAFDEIEQRLSNAPEEAGESRARGRRILIVAPLGVVFRVNSRIQEVHILDIWMFEARKR